jgi:hypothetical protein
MAQPVEAAGRDVRVYEWSPEQREFQLAAGPATEARLRTLYYPHWKASAGGKPLATSPASDGALLIAVPPEATQVKVQFVEPPSTYLAGAISLLGLAACAFLLARKSPSARALISP